MSSQTRTRLLPVSDQYTREPASLYSKARPPGELAPSRSTRSWWLDENVPWPPSWSALWSVVSGELKLNTRWFCVSARRIPAVPRVIPWTPPSGPADRHRVDSSAVAPLRLQSTEEKEPCPKRTSAVPSPVPAPPVVNGARNA